MLRPYPPMSARHYERTLRQDLAPLLAIALLHLLVHALLNWRYGFHRDELATLDDARHLAWGYVAYPPLAPAVARVSLELFGPSLVGLRLFSGLALGAAILLAGLMARELGGGRFAQLTAAAAVAIAPIVIVQGGIFQYVALDYFWWVLIAFLSIRLLASGDRRWWLAIGAAIGLGMLTKYTLGLLVIGLVLGVLLTPSRRDLLTPWPYAGAAVALLIWLPNLLWQLQHDFVSLEFLGAIRARDVAIGRSDGFLPEQLFVSASPITLPLWLAGLWFYLGHRDGRPFRLLGWMYVVPLALLLILRGRSYYLAPAYPMLFAAGALLWERRVATLAPGRARLARGGTWGGLALGALLFGAVGLQLAPIGSPLWQLSSEVHDNFVEQVGWPELAEQVAAVYNGLPAEERARAGILAGNYGQAGALNLYGPALGLPTAISGVNSYWLRGYGDPPPETLVTIGLSPARLAELFARCEPVGPVTIPYGVENEEATSGLPIQICREPLRPWPELWAALRGFG
jgi:4-amino-4-deoxy-L-arabinose transferase-like glycosyltransferase